MVTVTKAIKPDEMPVKPMFDTTGGQVFECEFCNMDLDRHRDRFTEGVLQKFAADSQKGVPLLYGHDQSNPIGKAFGGQVIGGKLMGYAWIMDEAVMPKQPAIKVSYAVEKKVVGGVSVGFRGHIRSAKQDSVGNTLEWEWFIPTTGENVTELNELSVLTVPAQPNAGFKSLDLDTKKQNHKLNMSHTKSITAGGASFEIKAAMSGDAITLDTTAIEQGIKALETAKAESDGKVTALTTENTALKADIANIRKPFEDQVLNHEGTKGAAGLTEAQVKAMPFEQLKAAAEKALEALGSENGTKGTDTATKSFDKYND